MTTAAQLNLIIEENRAGRQRGIASWCTAHPEVLRSILKAHRGIDGPILIEATCNQVNHRGGYTGMTPAAFRRFVESLANEVAVDPQRVILGGDHLGPNPWRSFTAAAAMAEAKAMVKAYVEAGFSKIHLDASMACADDGDLAEEVMAQRAAELCAVAEAAATEPLSYVIGTEVPIPGGETEQLDSLAVTRPEALKRTYALHEMEFRKLGLNDAFKRVIAVVVQPGVDFGNSQVFSFDAAKATELVAASTSLPHALLEAHSTDYQSLDCLSGLVAGHFAILKVGPELTFAYREAVFAMAAIEEQLPVSTPSGVIDAIDDAMNRDDRHWRGYVQSGEGERVFKLFGLSDRVRYYWPDPSIAQAIERLRFNIDNSAIPIGLMLQFAGDIAAGGTAQPLSERIIDEKVGAAVRRYLKACRSLN